MTFSSVGIVGLGLMGGSLARALRAVSPAVHISAFSLSTEDTHAALEQGVIDVACGDAAVWLVEERADPALKERLEGFWREVGGVPGWEDLERGDIEAVLEVMEKTRHWKDGAQ